MILFFNDMFLMHDSIKCCINRIRPTMTASGVLRGPKEPTPKLTTS